MICQRCGGALTPNKSNGYLHDREEDWLSAGGPHKPVPVERPRSQVESLLRAVERLDDAGRRRP